MSSNPYDVSGLSDGFINGYHAAVEARRQQADEHYQNGMLELARARYGLESKLNDAQINQLGATTAHEQAATTGLQQETQQSGETYQYNVSQRGLEQAAKQAEIDAKQATARHEVAAAGLANAQAGYLGAESNRENQKQLARQTAGDLQTTSELLKQYDFSDDNTINSLKALDAAVNHGMPMQGVNQTALTMLKNSDIPELRKDIGQKIDARHAEAYGLPPDSVLIDSTPTAIHVDPKTGQTAIEVNREYKLPDGTTKVVNMPHVDGDDNVVMIPTHNLQALVGGMGTMAIAASNAKASGQDPNAAVKGYVEAKLDGIKTMYPDLYLGIGRNGVADKTMGIGETGASPMSDPAAQQRKAWLDTTNKILSGKFNPAITQSKLAAAKAQFRQNGYDPDTDTYNPGTPVTNTPGGLAGSPAAGVPPTGQSNIPAWAQ